MDYDTDIDLKDVFKSFNHHVLSLGIKPIHNSPKDMVEW